MTSKPAAYIRKSKKHEESARAQLAAIKKIAARDGVNGELVVYSDVGVSGRYGQRGAGTAWARLLADIEDGQISAVYISVLDRASRSIAEWERFTWLLRQHGARLVDQSGEDRASEEGEDLALMEMLFAQREGKKSRERSARANRTQVARGDYISHAPYGFRKARGEEVIKDGQNLGRRIVPEPNPAEPLDEVLAAVRETGGNILRACHLLAERGMVARGGRAFGSKVLGRIVEREAPNLLPPKTGRIKQRVAASGLSHLSRLVVCHCGQVMTPNRNRAEMYCSYGHQQGFKVHGRIVARQWKIDAALREASALLPLVVEMRPWSPDADTDKKAAIEARRERFRDLYGEGEITREHWTRERDRADTDLASLTEEQDLFVAAGPLRPKVDWDADAGTLGDQLRAVSRVRLDDQMNPSVEWLVPRPVVKKRSRR